MACGNDYNAGHMTQHEEWVYRNFGSWEDLLCSICSAVEQGKGKELLDSTTPIAKWWKLHKEKDKKKLAEAAADKQRVELIKSAKLKLTKEEREALGMRD